MPERFEIDVAVIGAGVIGLACLFASLVLALQPVGNPLNSASLSQNVITVICSLGASAVAAMVALHYLPRSTALSRSGLISTAVLDKGATPDHVDEQGYPTSSPLLNVERTSK